MEFGSVLIYVGAGIVILILLRIIFSFFRKKGKGQNNQKEQLNKAKQKQIEEEILKDKLEEQKKAKNLPGREDKERAIQELRQLENRDKRLEKEELKAA